MAKESDHVQMVVAKWPMSQRLGQSRIVFDESNATSDWTVVIVSIGKNIDVSLMRSTKAFAMIAMMECWLTRPPVLRAQSSLLAPCLPIDRLVSRTVDPLGSGCRKKDRRREPKTLWLFAVKSANVKWKKCAFVVVRRSSGGLKTAIFESRRLMSQLMVRYGVQSTDNDVECE